MNKRKYNIISGIIAGVISFSLSVIVSLTTTLDAKTVDIVPSEIKSEPREIEVNTITEEPVVEEWIDGGYNERVYIGEFIATAYCPCAKCCGEWADGITATGTIATEGRTIAVDPDVIPLGSLVEINGINYVAEDIGGAIDDNRVDIFFNSHEDALEFGKRKLGVYMVEECLGGFF